MITRMQNAAALVATWKALAIEARACGADDAADELEALVPEGEAVLSQWKELYSAYEDVARSRDAALTRADCATAGFASGEVSYSQQQDALGAVRALELRVEEARGACTTCLSRGIEARNRKALAPWRAAEGNIESIVVACLQGHGHELHAADRDLDDLHVASFEPIAVARALDSYPDLARDPAYRSRALDLKQVKEAFKYRTERRARRVSPTLEVVSQTKDNRR